MNPHVRYVTQQSMWGTQYGKPLTNRTIAKYEREGYYSNGIVKAVVQNKKRETKKQKLAEMFAGF